MAAVTALHGLRYHGEIQPGQKVLINGPSGGAGTFTVQIAKSYGAEVTGVTSPRNIDLVRSPGADHVVDYTTTDFARGGRRYGLILDTVGNRSVPDLRRALAEGGKAAVTGFASAAMLIRVSLRGGAGPGGRWSWGPRKDIARQVVVAAGPFQVPFIPPVGDGLDPGVHQIHSAHYRHRKVSRRERSWSSAPRTPAARSPGSSRPPTA